MMSSFKVIKEWLAEYKALSESEIHTYANTLRHNDELVTSLYEVLEQRPGVEILDPICHQLFEFFRSKELELQRFTFEFIPTLTWLYLSMVTSNEKKNCSGLEAFFLGIYNLEIVYPDGSPKIKTYRVPSLAQPSVYHEPVNLSTLALTESALARYEKTEAETWTGNRHPQYEMIHGQNRQEILTYVMQCYNADIASMSPQSHQSLCDTCQRIATNGFSRLSFPDTDKIDGSMISSCAKSSDSFNTKSDLKNSSVHSPEVRIPVSSPLLIEMLTGVYFTMFNGQSKLAVKAVEDIHHRATYELYADVLLVTNAVRNCLKYSPSGQPDTAMGIGVALSPAPSSSVTMSKSAITNASFRATKLPDDISVPDDENDASAKPLPTIDEDADSPGEKSNNKPSSRPPKSARKSDKAKKERRCNSETSELPSLRSSVFNGESSLSDISVAIIKNRERTIVDNLEMTDMTPKMPPTSSSVDDSIMAAASGSQDDNDKMHGPVKYKMQSSNSLGKDMKLA
ncbi:Hypothetical predicted protein [Octopus vulgaris]|uniref:Hyccin n=1 Tax=Octopus vulgaris TaxID=6645 RepID=A0AA36AMA9_OCTVU|nr:Hypothetical predicted protein [Octopus vulgaris]